MGELGERLSAALAGRYVIEGELGRGGMATVFRALDPRHDRRVAIKVLDPDVGMAVGADRFHREIQIAAKLTHPHILPVHDSGEADGLLFYVMPLVEGESLRGRMTREQQMPIDDAIRITMEVADALSHAHSYGVVHRDIKPENILLQSGHAVVADFGIARAVADSGGERLTQTGASIGTPLYMSPEQASGDPNVDGRSDVYSLACVLYEMLIGQPPFTGPNAMAIIARHTMESVPSLQVVRQTIPDELEDTLFTALEKVPADRFATAAQFRDALESALLAAPITRRSPTMRVSRTMRSTRNYRTAQTRRSRLIMGAVAAAVLLAAGGAWYAFGKNPRRAAAAGASLNERRVAVLYFTDESRDSSLTFLADGLTESLIDRLRQVSALDVISANGVQPYRRADVSRDSIARALDAGTLVAGAVEPEGDRVRVSVRLFDASGVDFRRGSWAVPAGEIAGIERALADSVEQFLRTRLGDEIRLREGARATASAEAWTQYQRAVAARRSASAAFGADSVAGLMLYTQADSMLAIAVAADPEWLEPRLLRCEIPLELSLFYQRNRSRFASAIRSAEACADSVLVQDPRNADALEIRGTARFRAVAGNLPGTPAESDRIFAAAEQDLKASTEVNPRQAGAWATLSQLHYRKYDVVNAKLAAQRAYETDEFLVRADGVLYRLFATSYDLQQFEEAGRHCEQGYRRFAAQARFTYCKLLLMSVPGVQPRIPEAWATADSLVAKYPEAERPFRTLEARVWVAAALARANMADSARAVLMTARATPQQDPGLELMGYEAVVRTMLGDRDEALRLIRTYLTTNPQHRAGFGRTNSWWWDPLKGDARYREFASG